jgi:hypothetical protein
MWKVCKCINASCFWLPCQAGKEFLQASEHCEYWTQSPTSLQRMSINLWVRNRSWMFWNAQRSICGIRMSYHTGFYLGFASAVREFKYLNRRKTQPERIFRYKTVNSEISQRGTNYRFLFVRFTSS